MSAIEHVPAEASTYALIPMAADLADRLAKTDFVPQGLRGKPEAVMAAMLQGHEVGLPPMMSLSKIAVINGRPSMASEAMRALVLSHGHEIWFDEKNTTKVTVCGSRAGSDRVSRVTWTMDDAKRAGLAGKDGWRKYPRAYLTARATSELCRDIFADVLGGVSYTPEEVEDLEVIDLDPEGAADLGDGVAAPAAKRTRKAVTRKGAAKRAAPAVENAAPLAPPQPPLPGEDGYDNVLELAPSSARESEGSASTALDGETQIVSVETDDLIASGAAEIDLEATLKTASMSPAKFLRQARSVAKARGDDVPTSFEEIADELVVATLDDLQLAAMLKTTPAGSDGSAARNGKMWALAAEAFPHLDDEERDVYRKALIAQVTTGRTTSSKALDDGEWSDLFEALESIAEGVLELVDVPAKGWTLQPAQET